MLPRAPFIFCGGRFFFFSLLRLMCSQSGEGETLLSNFACHLSPNHFKDEALAKDFPPFFLLALSPLFLCSLSFPPFPATPSPLDLQSSPQRQENRGHLKRASAAHNVVKKSGSGVFTFRCHSNSATSATCRASAQLPPSRRATAAD